MGRLLNQILKLNNLAAAWDEVVEAQGGPGSDGVSLEAFARRWEAHLVEVAAAVRANRYRPDRLQRFTIPKKDGSPRLLGNLTVRDKVLQRAVLRVLDDLYESFFLDGSFAYRPKRSVKQAVERVIAARNLGRVWVLDADIDDFFHSLDHGLLLRFLRENISDEALLTLLKLWLKQGQPHRDRPVGTPLGAVISPLLSNIYLHYLDLVMTGQMPLFGLAPPMNLGSGTPTPASTPTENVFETRLSSQALNSFNDEAQPDWVYIRYADDFIVLCRSEAQAAMALRWVEETVQTLRLRLEPTKTTITSFEAGFEYLGCTFRRDFFFFNYQEKQITVREDEDWGLFYQYGPEGYE